VTTPTAPAAGVHLPWARVPEAVQAWAARLGEGGQPSSVRDLSGGFSPGATSILEWPHRAFFVKAVGSTLNPDSPGMHRREAVISAALPETSRYPRLRGTYDDGEWVALAFDVVAGRPPRHPWDATELELVARGLSTMHAELTPSPVPSLEPLADYAQRLFGGWADLASRAEPPVRLDPWAAAHLSRLAALEAAWPGACAGSTLVHGDVRSDNVLVSGDAVVFVDWPHGAVGNPAFDLIAWAPSVVLEGGPPPEELLARHDPPGVTDAEALTVLLCAIAGFFVSHSLWPAPPGLPTLRPFQAAQGEVALAWLRRRTGW
jgi:aminoglycoside phosphotransferase (APT) family kinase protein